MRTESFISILKKEVMRKFEFGGFSDAEQAISRFISFYDNERLHSGVGYISQRQAQDVYTFCCKFE